MFLLLAVLIIPVRSQAAASYKVRYSYKSGSQTVTGTVNVTATSASQGIQKALSMAKKTSSTVTVSIPNGTYFLTKSLIVYSNTKLSLASGVKIKRRSGMKGPMLCVGGNKSLGGRYKQASNVVISGGIWVGNPTSGYSEGSVMRFIHCQKITLKNCTIQNYSGKHAVVLAGVNNATVNKVTIKNQVVYAGGTLAKATTSVKSHAEALHIDTTSAEGEPDAYPIDNTPCHNITVTNCIFNNVLCGIGGHVKKDVLGKNLTIKNNQFRNIKYICLNLYNKRNVVLTNNKVHNIKTFLVAYNTKYKTKKNPIKY